MGTTLTKGETSVWIVSELINSDKLVRGFHEANPHWVFLFWFTEFHKHQNCAQFWYTAISVPFISADFEIIMFFFIFNHCSQWYYCKMMWNGGWCKNHIDNHGPVFFTTEIAHWNSNWKSMTIPSLPQIIHCTPNFMILRSWSKWGALGIWHR